ncbi:MULTISPECIES: hypothetical protein [unclassified Streptomyces]|uniref:hypothetical protein n=1 Tax=unclassified Streptomyces TaxID=2593676 RepID=UPI0004BD7F89|nr:MULTISPECIES: hypothetical protein [unclassified Streptomyces]
MTEQVVLAHLPVDFARPVGSVTYIIGHSQLLLRGHRNDEQGLSTTLEVLFKNETALSVRASYPALTIRDASAEEEAELREAVPDPWYDARAFVLGERAAPEAGAAGQAKGRRMPWVSRA